MVIIFRFNYTQIDLDDRDPVLISWLVRLSLDRPLPRSIVTIFAPAMFAMDEFPFKLWWWANFLLDLMQNISTLYPPLSMAIASFS